MLDETLDQPDSSRNRVMAQVAAHLLIAPSLEHLINGLRLRMQQRNRPRVLSPQQTNRTQIQRLLRVGKAWPEFLQPLGKKLHPLSL